MALVWAALMPHPPVILPEVGKGREKEASATLAGIAALLEKVRALPASLEALVVLSPHQPHVPDALFVNTAAAPQGDFSRFGVPSLCVSWQTSAPLLRKFAAFLQKLGIPAGYGEAANATADHGTMVPLRLLSQIWPHGLPPVLVANPSGLKPEQAYALGEALALLAQEHDMALLASGDLSHRLKKDGPYGFHPAGPVFDKALTEALAAGDASPVLHLDRKIRDDAGECGLRPALALLGLCRAPLQVLSYEGPFGVGYCTALYSPGTITKETLA